MDAPLPARSSRGEGEEDFRWLLQEAHPLEWSILLEPPNAREIGPRLCAEHQPQRHCEATPLGMIRRVCASTVAAAGPSDTAALRWSFHDAHLR